MFLKPLAFIPLHPSEGPKAKKDADPSFIRIVYSRFSWASFGVPQREFIAYSPLQKKFANPTLIITEFIEFEIASWVGRTVIILIPTFMKFGQVVRNSNFYAQSMMS